MEEIIIRKKDLENLGRKLMKEVYKFLHDEYILTFEEMKVEKDKIEKYLVKFYFKNSNFSLLNEYKLKEIEDKIENESLNIDLIFEVLDLIELDFEINEDLFSKKKAFEYNYLVFDHYHTYLYD